MDRVEWPLKAALAVAPPVDPEVVQFEPKRRLGCPDYKMDSSWLPPADQRELMTRAAAIGITPREFATQALRFAMANQKGTTS